MHLLNLALGELLLLFGVLGGAVTALYLLDRSRRGVAVATLRFWTHASRPVVATTRRRIRQWTSLLMQLLALLLLLLAAGHLRWGSREDGSRDHVLLLDTSSWSAARANGRSLLQTAQAQALAYLRSLPAGDRVMVVYAGALATPASGFETNMAMVEQAIRAAGSGTAALDLRQALDFANHARRNARRPGEIVFAGAGRALLREPGEAMPAPENLRLLLPERQPDNVGLRKVGLRRAAGDPGAWQALVSVRNYGSRMRGIELLLLFGGAPVGTAQLRLAPGVEQETTFEFRTRAAGMLEARVRSREDAFPGDDRAALELPAAPLIRAMVCTAEPSLLRPLLEANPVVSAVFVPPSECSPAADTSLVVLDRAAPLQPLKQASIWIEPLPRDSPARVLKTAGGLTVTQWRSDHALGRGLRVRDLRLESASILQPAEGDVVVAESGAGPVLLARPARAPDHAGMVIFGFHPMRSSLRYELSTPLLFANILRWLQPETFRSWEIQASSIGMVSVPMEEDLRLEQVSVTDARQRSLPFTLSGGTLRFFSGEPGAVRVRTGESEQVYSLTLPEVPENVWEPPAEVARGIPPRRGRQGPARDIWQWAAVAAGLLLFWEYRRYGPRGRSPAYPDWRRVLRIDLWRRRRDAPVRRAS